MYARQKAFTLVELLVVIAIIGILVALLLPAVQAAREAARRMQCTNNLKQISLAMHNYHDTHKTLPPGCIGYQYGTWMVWLMPFMEQTSAHALYTNAGMYTNRNTSYNSPVNFPVTGQRYPVFLCPSGGLVPLLYNIAKHNYVVNFGNTASWCPGWLQPGGSLGGGPVKLYNGVNFLGAPFAMTGSTNVGIYTCRFGGIPDGLSNTLCVSETVQTASGSGTAADPWDVRGHTFYGPNTFFTTHAPPNTKMPDLTTLAIYCNNVLNPKHPCATGQQNGCYLVNNFARSEHPGGVSASLLDGSVRFYSNDIDVIVWRAMGTTGGNEPVASP